MIRVFSSDPAAVPHVPRANALANGDVVRALASFCKSEVLLPHSVELVAPANGSAHGTVRMVVDTDTGEIEDVGQPVVAYGTSDEEMLHRLLHELAHFHDVSTRKAMGIRMRNVGSSLLWSEYFAERACVSVGLSGLDMGLLHAARPKPPNPLPDDGHRDEHFTMLEYYLMWSLACLDGGHAVPTELDGFEAMAGEVKSFWSGVGDISLSQVHRAFPNWTAYDRKMLQICLQAVETRVRPEARGGRRARRRRRR